MKIQLSELANFPDYAQRAEWSRILNVDAVTLYRADKLGRLGVSRNSSGRVYYSKAQILQWLGIDAKDLVIAEANSKNDHFEFGYDR